MAVVHVINHTHWDREWFLTHEYTTAWIPTLMDSLERLADHNPDYEFLFDGQTLVIEDLLATQPAYGELVQRLVGKGNLTVGPLYSQPDFRMVSGELQLRNLSYGIADAEAVGGAPEVAWLVDTFGHISQTPQMLALAGVDAAFVWRGVPDMTPVFRWEGADGTTLPGIDLFGGYRNLYGITKTADIAVHRLAAEVEKLSGEYGDIPIPLFDGYDLDTEPEDPVEYYRALPVPSSIELVASSPRKYVDTVRPFLETAPTIAGELLSGKFGSTFPGSLSARTYLKVLHNDAERAVHRRIEPLATLAAAFGVEYDEARYQAASRELLRNGVHDCLCGVSIDQVHERMERSYRRLLDWAGGRERALASSILGGFAPGTYAIATTTQPSSAIVRVSDRAVRVQTDGIGVTPVLEEHPIRVVDTEVESFSWSNAHYSARLDGSGLFVEGVGELLRLVVREDRGDTYSSEPGELVGPMRRVGPLVRVDKSDLDATLRYRLALDAGADGISVDATVVVRFDDGPVIDLTVTLDSSGTGFRVEAEFATGVTAPTVLAGMPFDLVERSHDDLDLLPAEVEPALSAILMGQRETGHVTEFPFHDLVATGDEHRAALVLADGIRSYRSSPEGTIAVTLRRSVEWLALTDLSLRQGDAGPAMYVPGARSERAVTHRLGFASVPDLDPAALVGASESFHHPPLVADVADGFPDGPDRWPVYAAPLPSTGLRRDHDGSSIVRLYNPTIEPVSVEQPLRRRSLRGADLGPSGAVRPKEIVSAAIDVRAPAPAPRTPARVRVHSRIIDRVGRSRSRPHPERLAELAARIDEVGAELAGTVESLEGVTGDARYLLTHRQYVLERELLELRLSHELGVRLRDSTSEVSIPDEPDPQIAELGTALNELRVKRRIYDYVAQALAER